MDECSYNLGRNKNYTSVQNRDMCRDFVSVGSRSSIQIVGDGLFACSVGVYFVGTCGGHLIQVVLVVVQKLYEHEYEFL